MLYDYDIIRSHRKSISISVSNDNKITVRCPWGLSAKEINKYLDSKSDWLEKVVRRNAARLAANDDILEFKKVYWNGKKMPLVISDKNEITPEAVYVKKIDDIEKVYKKYCFEGFLRTVEELSELTMLKPASGGVRSYKGRWGCCDSKNNLMFNYMLFMLPSEVQRYVIIHELCHILCHNHSRAFWKLVSDYEPDYVRLKKELSKYDFLTSVY